MHISLLSFSASILVIHLLANVNFKWKKCLFFLKICFVMVRYNVSGGLFFNGNGFFPYPKASIDQKL